MTSRPKMIIDTLKDNKDKKFTARELAKLFVERYPTELAKKRSNPRYDSDDKFIAQLAAEIGGERIVRAKQQCPNIATREKPRPRLYYWNDDPTVISVANDDQDKELESSESSFLEHDLYPMLIEFLNKDMGLYCQRIDERRSINTQGSGGNHWLHPDIVALEPLDQLWNESVRTCVRHGNDKSVRLWSFEVKKELTRGNVRKCFFQAVSNSSWANYGYLVATSMASGVEPELQMLCSLHGIGVLLLDIEDLYNSQILIPAKEKMNVDWLSANRIVAENIDFTNYIEQVGIYHQTGKLILSAWNK
ncbi:HrgA protein [Alteromonas mediterranea]|uniref:COG2958 family protein n=1 Tax=Alteromonas mediterranea TaxID=314275 RepID=UPI00090341BA|nr:HrgA protein [Alteromonas mediterranea]APE03100.1 HrgA protein [Alteromonas mediterranea]